jgi:RNA polymerase sigma factor (TIGR02999 family)
MAAMTSSGESVPELLTSISEGDRRAASKLLPLVYDELKAIARRRMAGGGPQTLQPTAVVHEAYLRLAGDADREWSGKTHFYAVAAKAIRQILVDRARRRGRIKRGGGEARERIALDVVEADTADDGDDIDLVALDDALRRLAEEAGERKCEVVVLRYFAGMTVEQIAVALGVTSRTVDRDWRFARAWLLDTMGTGTSDEREAARGE